MTLTTQAGIVSGLRRAEPFVKVNPGGNPGVGSFISSWSFTGNPPAGGFDSTAAGVALTAPVTGQLRHLDHPTGAAYLARLQAAASSAGLLLVCDRLWHSGGLSTTITTSQTVNSATFAARDDTGTTNGEGVLIGLEISGNAGSAAPTITLGYTNSAGTASRTGTNSLPTISSPGTGTFFPIGLQSGDVGVRSVQSVQLNASWVAGSMTLTAYRVLAALDVPAALTLRDGGALTLCRPEIPDGAVPFLLFRPATGGTLTLTGQYVETQG